MYEGRCICGIRHGDCWGDKHVMTAEIAETADTALRDDKHLLCVYFQVEGLGAQASNLQECTVCAEQLCSGV